tara:strand:- start:488 stop:685 length:198 start_codon:yes stop_codon:yes gene_type:complete
MTPEQRDKLQDDYVWACVNDMDLEGLRDYAADCLSHYLDKDTSNDELIELVKELYPELLNDRTYT